MALYEVAFLKAFSMVPVFVYSFIFKNCHWCSWFGGGGEMLRSLFWTNSTTMARNTTNSDFTMTLWATLLTLMMVTMISSSARLQINKLWSVHFNFSIIPVFDFGISHWLLFRRILLIGSSSFHMTSFQTLGFVFGLFGSWVLCWLCLHLYMPRFVSIVVFCCSFYIFYMILSEC